MPRSCTAAALMLLAGCTQPEPLKPGTFAASFSGAARRAWTGEAEFCRWASGEGTISLVSAADSLGLLFLSTAMKPAIFQGVDRRDVESMAANQVVVDLYAPDSIVARPYLRSGSLRVSEMDSTHVAGNFAVTLQPFGAEPRKAREDAVVIRGSFVARPRRAPCGEG